MLIIFPKNFKSSDFDYWGTKVVATIMLCLVPSSIDCIFLYIVPLLNLGYWLGFSTGQT